MTPCQVVRICARRGEGSTGCPDKVPYDVTLAAGARESRNFRCPEPRCTRQRPNIARENRIVRPTGLGYPDRVRPVQAECARNAAKSKPTRAGNGPPKKRCPLPVAGGTGA